MTLERQRDAERDKQRERDRETVTEREGIMERGEREQEGKDWHLLDLCCVYTCTKCFRGISMMDQHITSYSRRSEREISEHNCTVDQEQKAQSSDMILRLYTYLGVDNAIPQQISQRLTFADFLCTFSSIYPRRRLPREKAQDLMSHSRISPMSASCDAENINVIGILTRDRKFVRKISR